MATHTRLRIHASHFPPSLCCWHDSPLAHGGGGSGGGDCIFQNIEHPHQEQLVDWDTLQIVERQDEEEGWMELIDEDQVYVLLGLRDEDDKAEQAAKEAVAAAGADGDKGKAPAMEDTLIIGML